LLGSGFQRLTFLFLQVPELPPASPTSLLLLTTTVQLSSDSTTHLKTKPKLCYDRRSVGQSVLVSNPPSGAQDQIFLLSVAGLFMWGALSKNRTGLLFTINAGLRQRSHSRVRVPRNSWPYCTVSHSRPLQPGGLGPCIYIPQEQDGPVIPPGTGFPFRPLLLFAGIRWRYSNPSHGNYLSLLYSLARTAQETSLPFMCSFVAGKTCPQSCSLATAVTCGCHTGKEVKRVRTPRARVATMERRSQGAVQRDALAVSNWRPSADP
jgi:hypothetical protein